MTTQQKPPLRKFYHGTAAVLFPGDILMPGDSIGVSNFPGMDNSWGVWMSTTPNLARGYGERVYQVQPLDHVTDWCEENGWDRDETNDEYVTSSARVIGEIVDEMQEANREMEADLWNSDR